MKLYCRQDVDSARLDYPVSMTQPTASNSNPLPADLAVRVRDILKDCSDDLRAEIHDRYPEELCKVYPSYAAKCNLSLAPVREAELAIAELTAHIEQQRPLQGWAEERNDEDTRQRQQRECGDTVRQGEREEMRDIGDDLQSQRVGEQSVGTGRLTKSTYKPKTKDREYCRYTPPTRHPAGQHTGVENVAAGESMELQAMETFLEYPLCNRRTIKRLT